MRPNLRVLGLSALSLLPAAALLHTASPAAAATLDSGAALAALQTLEPVSDYGVRFDRNLSNFQTGRDGAEIYSRSTAARRPASGAARQEQEIFGMVNRERARRGLQPLAWDDKLCRAGQGHSNDMARRGYFSHFSPEGDSITERVLALGIDFTSLGENIALDVSAAEAHKSLMHSPGHRENILCPSYGRIGIGIARNSQGQLLVTQVFTD